MRREDKLQYIGFRRADCAGRLIADSGFSGV